MHVKSLSIQKNDIAILEDISFEIKQGSILAVLGLNGAGKSTLAKAIAGHVPSTFECLEIDGISLKNMKAHARAQTGIIYVPEGKELFLNMTVFENLEIGALVRSLYPHKKDITKKIAEVFDLFPKLSERKNQKADSLSGGEQQMLCIGRALMANPKLLLLDEPSQGLAPLIFKSILTTLETLKSKGMRIMLIEQYAEEALRISDDSITLENGRLLKPRI